MTQRSRLRFALFVNFLDSAYQFSFKNSIARAAHSQGVDLIVGIGRELDHTDTSERALNVVYDWLGAQSVDGVILLGGAMANFAGARGIAALCERLLPVPSVSIGLELAGIPSLVFDNRAAMQVAVAHLIAQHGCKRIAYIGGPEHNQEARARRRGYELALEEAGLEVDPRLIAAGHFSSPTGRDAMATILGRSRELDAVVAANDYMALGAMDLLRTHGFGIPEDVKVVGFDDSPISRFAVRSLSTVAQPIDEMSELAIRALVARLEGRSFRPDALEVHFIARESCGCGYVVRGSLRSAPEHGGNAVEYLRKQRAALIAHMLSIAGAAHGLWSTFVPQMVDALTEELAGTTGGFLRCLEATAERAEGREGSLDDLGRAVLALRRELRTAGFHGADHLEIEEVCLKAFAFASGIATRREGRRALDLMDRAYGLRHLHQQLSVVLDSHGLGELLGSFLPDAGVRTAFLARVSSDAPDSLTPLFALEEGRVVHLPAEPYRATRAFPEHFPNAHEPSSLVLLPLTFEQEILGSIAFDAETDPFMCELLRGQISASLKLGALHAQVVRDTALRERLLHEQLLGELAVARRIQTALAPRHLAVPALEISAGMQPADQVGGDYYDVLAVPGGCFIGVGDVTGHGLLAGLIMLMIQSTVATLVATQPDALPSALVCSLNDVLRPNIRERLQTDDHATFVLARYFDDGRVLFAGAHEDIILYRKRTRSTELVETRGVWIGILPDIRSMTEADVELRLEPGDLLVIYTDGLVEARNARGEMFGIDRARALVEQMGDEPTDDIRRALLEAASSWNPSQGDDITLVVMRHRGSTLA